MSHFTTVKTRLVSSKHLVRALRDMGYDEIEVHQEPQVLRNWMGGTTDRRAQVILRKGTLGKLSNDIGFLQNDEGTLDFIGDEAGLGQALQPWVEKLNQRYAYHVTKDLLAQQDFSLVEEEEDVDGAIHITLRRMAN